MTHPSTKIYTVIPGEEKHDPFLNEYPRKLTLPVVYVADMVGTPFCKIGSTSNIRSRICTIQSASPFDIRCVFYLCPPDGRCHVQNEYYAHSVLNHKRHNGEWFDVCPEWAIDAIREAL